MFETMAPETTTSQASAPAVNGASNHPASDPAHANSNGAIGNAVPAAAPATPTKKGKKKTPEPNEASKLIAQRISQLELDAAGEKDQEAEIGG
jgi:hypothetical protein